jgi:hypothetical protein
MKGAARMPKIMAAIADPQQSGGLNINIRGWEGPYGRSYFPNNACPMA